MIKQNDYWEQFKQTGKINDYLAFKFSNSEGNINREIVDVDNNRGNSNS